MSRKNSWRERAEQLTRLTIRSLSSCCCFACLAAFLAAAAAAAGLFAFFLAAAFFVGVSEVGGAAGEGSTSAVPAGVGAVVTSLMLVLLLACLICFDCFGWRATLGACFFWGFCALLQVEPCTFASENQKTCTFARLWSKCGKTDEHWYV